MYRNGIYFCCIQCDPKDYPAAGPSAGNGEHAQIRKPDDTYGSGCLDYVSDSQLNTIVFK